MSLGSGIYVVNTLRVVPVPTTYLWTKDDKLRSMCFSPSESLKTPKFAKLSIYLLENPMCTAIFKPKRQHDYA